VNGAISISPKHANACPFEALQDFPAGMAIGIFFSRRNERDLGLYAAEEFLHGRVLASVVADFQHIGAQSILGRFRSNLALGLLLGIACQQKNALPVGESQDQRIVVSWGS